MFLGGQSMAILCTHSNKKKEDKEKERLRRKRMKRIRKKLPSEANQDYDSKRG